MKKNKKLILGIFIVVLTLLIAFLLITGQISKITGQPTSNTPPGYYSSKLYNLRVGEGITHNNKQVKLISVGNDKGIVVSVNNVQDTVKLGSKKSINGLEIKNSFVYPIYTTVFTNPATWSAWIYVREPPPRKIVTIGCKIEPVSNLDFSEETKVNELNDVNAIYITPTNENSRIKLIKVKDLQKTEVYSREVWVYDSSDLSYSCDTSNCDYYKGAIIYKDIKNNTRNLFGSLYYDGDFYINC